MKDFNSLWEIREDSYFFLTESGYTNYVYNSVTKKLRKSQLGLATPNHKILTAFNMGYFSVFSARTEEKPNSLHFYYIRNNIEEIIMEKIVETYFFDQYCLSGI